MDYKFYKQFPELEHCEFTINNKKTNYKYLGDNNRVMLFRDKEISRNCLSNQRVRDIINNLPELEDGRYGTIACNKKYILKELGVD